MSEPNKNPSVEIPSRKPRGLRQRLGCGLVLVLWFGLILTPCLCIVLATQGEINIQFGDPPANVLRFWLVNEARERGIGISSPIVLNTSTDAVCVLTTVSYLFWQGEGDSTHFCECYARTQGTEDWTLMDTKPESCPS